MNTLTIALTLPMYAVQRTLTVLHVEMAMLQISALTGQPVEAFYADAMTWCSERVSSYEESLNYACQMAARGEKLPWDAAGKVTA